MFLLHRALQKLALTSPTSGGRSVGIVRSRTKATELVSFLVNVNAPFMKRSAVLFFM
jgi:hypothetical protein